MSASVTRKLELAQKQLRSGDVDAAARALEQVLARAPRNPEALWLLGSAHLMRNRPHDAVPLFERALAAAPDNGAVLEHLGVAHLMRGDYIPAERALRKAAAAPGAPASVTMRLGLALLHQARPEDAIVELDRALAREPQNVDATLALGRAHAALGRWSDAAHAFERALELSPYNLDAVFNLGIARLEQGSADAARKCFERCLERQPGHIEARERHAAACLTLGRYRQALADLEAVAALQPENAPLLAVLAEARLQCGELDQAIATANKARLIDPELPGAYGVMAQIHQLRGELDEAADILAAGYDRTHADPLLGALVHVTHKLCDWARWEPAWRSMRARLDAGVDLGSPFWLLVESTTPAQQLAYARQWSQRRFPARNDPAPATGRSRARERLRVGYFSGDFYQHPVPALMVEVLEQHDRERFEVFAYSYGPDDNSEMRARIERAAEHFVDVRWDPDDQLVRKIRSDEIDVLIDLKGWTIGDRLAVLAQRPCNIQLSWIGFAGTSGAHFIDGIITDPVLVPAELEQYYSERVLRMPHCYLPSDRKRPAPVPRTRAEYGLPADAFVFCCFNQTVKITPDVFARWMSLLASVPGSVLWLLEDNRWASENLLAAARAANMHGRVIIAPRLPSAEHLARYRAADVALDTAPYTSHTTGSDALWLGCPLVALCGETFAARVSTSLLHSCGLQELVTHTLDEYEKLAHRLATDAAFLGGVRTKLADARANAPLFDSNQYTRDLEALYLKLASSGAR